MISLLKRSFRLLIILTLLISFSSNPHHVFAQEHEKQEHEVVSKQSSPETTEHKVEEDHEENGHKGNMSPLFFLIIALIIGAGTRHFLKKAHFPIQSPYL